VDVAVSKLAQQAVKIVNLDQYRKRRRRAEAERQAAQNRGRFERNRTERSKDRRDNARAEKDIEGKRLD
jgi:hypothetical protein